MMYIAYTSGYTLPRQDVASRVLRRAAVHTPGRGKVVYWLAAIGEFGLTRVQLLPQGVPVLAYVTYRLRLVFRPAALVADLEGGAALLLPNTAVAPELPRHLHALGQGRNYFSGPQEAVYEELVASRKLTMDGHLPALNLGPLTLAEITRELAGWTTPHRGMCGKQAPHADPTPGKRTHLKSRHD